MVKNNNKKGFTIIEVVLVLAIAGLIFLMVFIALPALQRSQRNTQRENDIARFMTAINDYRTQNGNKTPFQKADGSVQATDYSLNQSSDFVKRYIMGNNASDTGKFTDPNGTFYSFKVKNVKSNSQAAGSTYNSRASGKILASVTNVDNVIYVIPNSRCAGSEGQVTITNGAGDTSLLYVMEGGVVYCNSN